MERMLHSHTQMEGSRVYGAFPKGITSDHVQRCSHCATDTTGADSPPKMLFPRRFMFGTLVFERALQVLMLAAVIFICNNERGENHYYLARATQDIVSAFNKTSTRVDFWTWCDHTLLSRLFFTTWYNGRATDQDDYNRHTTNPDLFRIGQVRLKQVRVVPGQCRTPATMAAVVPECNVEYSTSNEDRGNYGENWTNMTSNTSTENTYWRYFTQTSYFDPPLYGHLAVYWGGGYVVDLGTSKEDGERIVRYLHRHDWLDRYTRAVMVEFTVYNANVNLFLAATLLVEYSHVGLAFHWISLHPFRLHYDLEGLWTYVTLSVNVFYVFLVFLETVTIGVRMYQEGKKFVREFWNIWEVFAWMCSAAAVGVFCWRYYLAGNVLAAIPADVTGQFLSFRQVSLCDCVLWYLLAGSVFTNTVRLLQLLAFSSSVAMLTDVIRQSTQHVVVFSVLVMLEFLAFMFCGYLLFGATLQHFQSPLGALLTGFGMLLGSIAFNDIIQADETLGRLYIFGFVVCLLFVLMNLFVGILNDTISQVKNSGRREDVEESGLSDLVRMIRQVLTNGGEAVPDKKMTVVQNVNEPRDHRKWDIWDRQVFPKDIMADLYTPQIYRLLHRVELLQRHVRELQKTFTMWDYFLDYLQSINYLDYIFTPPTDVYYDDIGDMYYVGNQVDDPDSLGVNCEVLWLDRGCVCFQLLMADPMGGLQQPCPWQNANIPAVLTVRGNIGDADLPHRLNAISTWLQQMAQKGDQEVKVSRVQPWNSVRVTFNIPRSAAQRLQQLAETRNQQLRDLGILAVQVEGHQEVVLNTPPPISMTGPPLAPGLPSTATPQFPQQSPQGVPRPAWATSPGGQVTPGEGMIPGQFSPVGNIRPPTAAQVPAFSFTAQQMGPQNRMPMPSPGGFVRPPQDQLPFRPEQVPSNTGGPPEQVGFPPTPQNFPRGFPPGFHPDGSSGFPGNQGPPGPMQGQMLPSMQVRGGATRLPVHHLLHNAGLAQSAGGGDPNLQGRDVTQSSPLLVNLLQNDISGNANISLAISRTTQSLMQQGGMQGNLQQQLAMLQQSGLLPQGNMASPGALQNMLQQAARQRNKSNQQADAPGLHAVPPLPSPQSAMSGSPALSAGSPALSASPNMSASPSMAGAGGMASPSTQHFPSAPSPSIQQGFPSTSSPSLPQGFPRNSSPAVQNNFPTTSSPAVPPNYPSTSSPAVPPNFPPTSSPAVPPNFPPSSSPMQPGFPPSSSPAMQLPTSTPSMPPGFPPTSASGVPPGFPPSSGAQPHFQPPSSVAMQQPGFPGMPAHANMTQQHQNFPNNPSPSFPQAMPDPPPCTPPSPTPPPLPCSRTSPGHPPLSPFPNRPPQPSMQQFSNPSQMFPNLPPNAQFPNMNQRFPNPSQQPFPSQQQQFSNMSQQRFPPSSSPNFQSPFPNTTSPNASMAAFINQMQNSAAKAAMSNNANVPPHVLNMREGGRGMNEGPSPLASLSNQVGQVPQPPMPPGMGQQHSPGPNKQQAMPPGGVKDVPFDPPTSAHSFLQGQAEFQSAFLRYVQSQQRQPPPRGGRRGSPGAATSPGLAGLGPRGAPPRAPQPGQTFPGPSPGSASPHQPTMEPPLGPGTMPSVSMGPNNGTPNQYHNPPVEGTPQNMGHPSMGPPQGPNGPAQPPPVTTAPSLGVVGPPIGTATPPLGTAGPTIGTAGPPLRTAGLPPGTAAPTPGTAGPAIRVAAQGLQTAAPTPGTAGPALRSAGLSPRLASPMPHSSSPTAGKTPGPGTSQQNQSVPDLSGMNQSQPDQTGKSGPSGDNTASQAPGETTQSQLQQGPAESLGGNGTASNVTAEPDNIKSPGSIAQQSVTHEKAGADEQASSPSVPPEVQGNGKTPCTASQVDPQPDGTGTGQDKPEGEGGSMGEGVSKGGAQEDTAPPQDSGSEMSASEGGGGGKGETVGMATEVVATPSNQEESIPVSSTETSCSTGGPVQSGSEGKQTLDVQQENTTTEAGNKDLPPAGEGGTAAPTKQAGSSETAAAVQQDLPGGTGGTTNSTSGQPASGQPASGTADDKKGEEKTPEVPTSSQEQTAKKRELPKDLEEKGPSPLKQSKS
ncbi:hypothetical protein Bbelb_083200 [Branchiostoma belcheri]|nr:hypothetical protein Bbelb_083200 [Branchiostoma belcheri]